MEKTTLLFDFDYTLADSSKGIFQCANHALESIGYRPQDFETIRKTIGRSLPDSFTLLTGDENQDKAKEYVKYFVACSDKIMNLNTVVYPEVVELFPKLKEKGFQIGIVSTKYRYRINGVLERDDLAKYVNLVVGGEDVEKHKPDPEGLLLAIEKLDINKQEVIYIGDSIVDAKAAAQAGIDFIATRTGTTTRDEFIAEGHLASIPNLEFLWEFLVRG